jgi:hypothetical protein
VWDISDCISEVKAVNRAIYEDRDRFNPDRKANIKPIDVADYVMRDSLAR